MALDMEHVIDQIVRLCAAVDSVKAIGLMGSRASYNRKLCLDEEGKVAYPG